jgi:hypothetical protein
MKLTDLQEAKYMTSTPVGEFFVLYDTANNAYCSAGSHNVTRHKSVEKAQIFESEEEAQSTLDSMIENCEEWLKRPRATARRTMTRTYRPRLTPSDEKMLHKYLKGLQHVKVAQCIVRTI